MTRCVLCFIFFVICLQKIVMAQQEAAAGFIVTNSNDTVKGIMMDKDWNISPESIKFKAADSEFKTYFPTDIKGFSVGSRDIYISGKVLIDLSPIQLDKLLKEGEEEDTVTKVIFMKELLRGKMSLFYHKDLMGKEHFFIKKDSTTLIELVQKKYKSSMNEIMLREKFRGQLAFYMNDCQPMIESIKRVHFNETELADLVIQYNKRLGQTPQVTSVISKSPPVKCGIIAGYFTSSIMFKGPVNSLGVQDADFRPYHNVTAGMNFVLRLSKRFERHQVVSEFLWKSLKFNGKNETSFIDAVTTQSVVSRREYNIDISYVKLNIFYRYNFVNGKKTRLFFDAGFSNSLAVYMNCTFRNEERTAYSYYIKEMPLFTRKHEQALTIGAGSFYLDKIGIKVAYEKSNGMSDYSHLKTNVNSFYFLVNYIISKK